MSTKDLDQFVKLEFSVHKSCSVCMICTERSKSPVCKKCFGKKCPYCDIEINKKDRITVEGPTDLSDYYYTTDHYKCFERFYLDRSFTGNIDMFYKAKRQSECNYYTPRMQDNLCVVCQIEDKCEKHDRSIYNNLKGVNCQKCMNSFIFCTELTYNCISCNDKWSENSSYLCQKCECGVIPHPLCLHCHCSVNQDTLRYHGYCALVLNTSSIKSAKISTRMKTNE